MSSIPGLRENSRLRRDPIFSPPFVRPGLQCLRMNKSELLLLKLAMQSKFNLMAPSVGSVSYVE